MKQWIKMMGLIPLAVMMLSCEEEVPDYAADIINTYIVESMVSGGATYDFTNLALEEAFFVKITRDEVIFYENSDDPCDDDYEIETNEIEGVTETAILYADDTQDDYSLENGNLRIEDGADVIILAEYTSQVPPAVWTDPSLLTNDTYEPDDSFTFATAIAAGGTVQNHYLAECGDQDFFVFSAIAGTRYFIGTTTPGEPILDLELTLYSGTNNELDYSDDYNYPNLNPGLDWTCPTSGDYYFVIDGFWDDEVGAYSVYVTITTGLLKTAGEPVEKQPRSQNKISPRDIFFN